MTSETVRRLTELRDQWLDRSADAAITSNIAYKNRQIGASMAADARAELYRQCAEELTTLLRQIREEPQTYESRSPDGDGSSMKSHAGGKCVVRPVEKQAPLKMGAASGEALRAGSEPADSPTSPKY